MSVIVVPNGLLTTCVLLLIILVRIADSVNPTVVVITASFERLAAYKVSLGPPVDDVAKILHQWTKPGYVGFKSNLRKVVFFTKKQSFRGRFHMVPNCPW